MTQMHRFPVHETEKAVRVRGIELEIDSSFKRRTACTERGIVAMCAVYWMK